MKTLHVDDPARLQRYATLALNAGAERDADLVAEAGSTDVDLSYAGLSWRGWLARA
jgi:hypothetical protein